MCFDQIECRLSEHVCEGECECTDKSSSDSFSGSSIHSEASSFVDWLQHLHRMERTASLVSKLLTKGAEEYEGRHFRVRPAPCSLVASAEEEIWQP